MSATQFAADDVRRWLADTAAQRAQAYAEPLAHYLNLLARWNAVYNLSGFRQREQLLDRVLLECLSVAHLLDGRAIADVGSGAGLPGLPLAITQPERRFTLIESRARRVHFLRHVAGELALANVVIEHARAEDLPEDTAFATVLARAVAAPPEFLAVARHLSRAGSRIVLMTSKATAAEYQQPLGDFELSRLEPLGPQGRFGVAVVLQRTE